MLFDFLYSLLNSIMATAIAPQQEDFVNGKGNLKENGANGNGAMVSDDGQANGGQRPNGPANGMVNGKIKVKKTEEATKNQQSAKLLTVKDWDYDEHGTCGPQNWLKICGCDHLGDCQSPIDLQLSKMSILPLNSAPLCLVNYTKPLLGQLVNNGCSIQFLPDAQMEPPEIYGGKLDQNYRFIQYHFHWAQNDNEGSEHTIGGIHYPAELHLVHKGVTDPNKLAVLAIFLKLDDGKENGHEKKLVFDGQEMDALKKLIDFDQKITLDSQHCLSAKLPANCCLLDKDTACAQQHFVSSFVRYRGSLTTPPCSENVTWTVFTDPLLISKEQLSLLRAVKDCCGRVIAKNYRPVQKIGNRDVCLLMAPSGKNNAMNGQ